MSAEKKLDKKTYVFKTVGELDLKVDAYGVADTVRPVLMWIHGGALMNGSREDAPADQLSAYIEAGFTVISIDYRLAPETKVDGIVEDLRDAWTWIQENGRSLLNIDPDRAGVVGHSAGGYLTLMSGFCVTPRPKALVAFYGYGDIVGPWMTKPDPFYCKEPRVSKEKAYSGVGGDLLVDPTDEEHRQGRARFYLYCRQEGIWPNEVAGHDPESEPDVFVPWCPEKNVTGEYPPTLLLHGDKDTDVPYDLSVKMAKILEEAGVEHELITLSGGGHAFDLGEEGISKVEVAPVFEVAVDFFKEKLL